MRPASIRYASAFFLALLLLGAASSAMGEVMFEYRPRWTLTRTDIRFQHWKLESGNSSSTISQFSLPVLATSPLSRNADFALSFAVVNSSLDANVEGSELPGISLGSVSDLKARTIFRFLQNHLMLGVGLNLPTGANEFDTEEERLWEAINNRVLGFSVQRLGEGFDLDLNVVAAHDLSPRLVLGGGVAYQVKGSFGLGERDGEARDYAPGNELSLSAGLHYGGETTALSVEGLFRTYGTDQLNSEDELKEGNQIELSASATRVLSVGRVSLTMAEIFKGDTEFIREGVTTSSFKNLTGNIFHVRGDLTRVLTERIDGVVHLGLNLFGENDLGVGDATVWDLGADARLKLAEPFIGRAGLSYLFGDAESGTVDLQGFDLSAGLSVNF
jgi:hypothetical protein